MWDEVLQPGASTSAEKLDAAAESEPGAAQTRRRRQGRPEDHAEEHAQLVLDVPSGMLLSSISSNVGVNGTAVSAQVAALPRPTATPSARFQAQASPRPTPSPHVRKPAERKRPRPPPPPLPPGILPPRPDALHAPRLFPQMQQHVLAIRDTTPPDGPSRIRRDDADSLDADSLKATLDSARALNPDYSEPPDHQRLLPYPASHLARRAGGPDDAGVHDFTLAISPAQSCSYSETALHAPRYTLTFGSEHHL